MKAAVLALNGASATELRRAVRLARQSDKTPLRIAVDGGLDTFVEAKMKPDLWAGDGDSAKPPKDGTEVVRYKRRKDFSDFAGALEEAARRKCTLAFVAGLVGGRFDHEQSNLQEAGKLARRFQAIVATTDRGRIWFTAKQIEVPMKPGTIFSLVPFGTGATITLKGARWELEQERLRAGSHGLSNEATGTVSLEVHRGSVSLWVRK